MLDLQPTALPGVFIISTRWFADDRGLFTENYNRDRWQAAGITAEFVQDNHVVSHHAGTVRGLHFQRAPMAQAKLVRVIRGAVWDVVVDIRQGSPTFGQWVGVELSAANRRQFFVPVGLAHGYVTLEADTEVLYKVDANYAPQTEGGIRWDDPALAIPWPLPASGAIVVDRDRDLPLLADHTPCFSYAE
jgi:dTDP-4-dehydrorhamnose 3,5-epimerase